MSAPLFTPGPWERIENMPFEITANGRSIDICEVFEGGQASTFPNTKEAHANARLIATAPELYGAALRLRNAQISYMSVRNADRTIREAAGRLVALAAEELDGILAKARGDQ